MCACAHTETHTKYIILGVLTENNSVNLRGRKAKKEFNPKYGQKSVLWREDFFGGHLLFEIKKRVGSKGRNENGHL